MRALIFSVILLHVAYISVFGRSSENVYSKSVIRSEDGKMYSAFKIVSPENVFPISDILEISIFWPEIILKISKKNDQISPPDTTF